ncbi:MAG: Gfo/Idh/MocA family oxidoreductase [Firmicutes bacterium]|nr:Gfo/Idh/MocA family oxidoreductase [Bacillota bacterium]
MEQVRFGIIGLGNMGKGHLGYFHRLEGAKLTAVCDIDESRFNIEFPADFDHDVEPIKLDDSIARFTDYKDLLDSGLVDAVIIAVPHYFHPEMTIEAFKRGIHVICEKPVAITAREARMMNEAWEKSDVVFAAMFQQRTSPIYQKIKELLEDGTLGEVRRVSWIITNWFRTQTYYDSGGWRGNWNGEGGGVLMNQCPHNLDLFQWFFGLPTKLTAQAYLGKWHDITVEDDISVLMEFENGATGSFITSTGDFPGTNRLEITTENGKLVCENNKLVFYKTEAPVQELLDTSPQGFYHARPEVVEIEVPEAPQGHMVVTQNVINTILGKEELLTPAIEGIKSVQLANGMLLSGLRNKTVELPVAEDEFDALLEELRADERENSPDKAFIWEDYLASLGK